MTNNLVRQIFLKIILYPHGIAVLERRFNCCFYSAVTNQSPSTLFVKNTYLYFLTRGLEINIVYLLIKKVLRPAQKIEMVSNRITTYHISQR
jgi:hypothetical protein